MILGPLLAIKQTLYTSLLDVLFSVLIKTKNLYYRIRVGDGEATFG
jgi:hypothetical protein